MIICTNIFKNETVDVRREEYTEAWARILPHIIQEEKISNEVIGNDPNN